MTIATGRQIPDRLTTPTARALKSWEALLLAVAVAIFIANSIASPYFLDPWNLSDASFNFTEKALIAFAMVRLFQLNQPQAIALMAFSSLPTASSCYVLAARMGYNGPYVAGLVTLSTVLGMLSLPFALGLLR